MGAERPPKGHAVGAYWALRGRLMGALRAPNGCLEGA